MARRRLLPVLALAAFALAGDRNAELKRRVESECAAVAETLEEHLGKKFKAPVPVELVTPEFIAEFALEMEEQMTPGDSGPAAQRMAERLHQIPKGYDLRGKQIEMLEMQVAGLYDADRDRFYVVDRAAQVRSPLFRITAAHELMHAYRDVDKDFWQRLLDAIVADADWAVAISCLAEGDATLLGQAIGTAMMQQRPPGPMVRLMAQEAPASARQMRAGFGTGPLAEFPYAVREMFIGRYAAGLVFAAAVFREGGVEALDAAFDRPPRSTEQVLHPEKYLGDEKDEPTVLEGGDPTAALGEGWKLSLTNVMGEFEIGVTFSEVLGREKALKAAAGWDGARFFFCEKEGVSAFYGLVSVWDSDEEAAEFAQAWVHWAMLRDTGTKGVSWRRDSGDLCVSSSEGFVCVRRDGSRVLIADGLPLQTGEAVLDALASATARERRADEKPLARHK